MDRYYRLGMYFSGAAAIMLLVVALMHPGGGSLTFRPMAISLDGLSPGVQYRVPVGVRNGTRLPVQLLGGNGSCGRYGCVELEGLPVIVPPGEQREFMIRVRAFGPGVLSASVTVFTDLSAQPWLTIPVDATNHQTEKEPPTTEEVSHVGEAM
jgi:hypothetical protein